MKIITFLLFLSSFLNWNTSEAQQVAILKYEGGGDWYANPTAIPNLIQFSNRNISTKIDKNPATVSADNVEIFNYPIVFMTGHGNVIFSENALENMRNYLKSGGFLHISDNYGMDKYIRREMKRLFPDAEFKEIPYNHPIYHQTFDFSKGVPKIHEHDKKRPQGFGLFIDGRLVCFYDYESDLSDGWEDKEIHNDDDETRLKALKMGANILEYVFTN
ncbi:DUF4159 domain-containing protein [Aureivirga marina]|uniref:DUF4159 domain-containing protein n=1 Tax=Aureivirga marina TaxID=1182451 RepID=UPI0037447D85